MTETVKKAQVIQLTQPLPTEIAVENGLWQPFYPVQSTFHPTTFTVPPDPSQYMDMSQIWLSLGMQLVKGTGASLDKVDFNVGVVNNIGHSVIRRMAVKLNNTSTGEPTDLYHQKAYFQNLFNFDTDQKNSYLAIEGWADDTPGRTHMDSYAAATAKDTFPAVGAANYNAGLLTRTKWFIKDIGKDGTENSGAGPEQASQTATFHIQPAVDIFQTTRPLIPGVGMDIQIDFNDSPIPIMCATGKVYKMKIVSAVLWVRWMNVSPAVHAENMKDMEGKSAVYPIVTTKPIRLNLQTGTQSFHFNDVFQQFVPDRLTVGLVKSTAFNGDYTKNPFYFELDSLKSIRFLVNGTERPYSRLEITSPDKVEAFDTLFQATGDYHRGFSPGIKRDDYNQGFALMRFNFTPDGKEGGNYRYRKNKGILDVNLEFGSPLTENFTLLLVPEFENEVLIDESRVVLMGENY